MIDQPKLTKKDFMSDQEIKWCPGCGDYAILSATQMAMAKLGVPPHKVCVVSGIGCSSRFPYYVSSYGMHSIHGRAPAVATGVKLQNPDLSVWVITGDGDGLSIGGNHLAHILRRNLDVNIILFNNEIYGLTKGQYSPTSQVGTKTKSSPFGSYDRPFTPAKFAMGVGATFFARTIDTDPKHMMQVFMEASAHKGTSLIEVFQNCIIFNDAVHEEFTDRKVRDDHTVRIEDGEPMIFGKDQDKALKLNGFDFEVTPNKDEALVHDSSNKNLAAMLANLDGVNGPVPLGVLQKITAPSYEEEFMRQIDVQVEKKGRGSVNELLHSGNTWQVS